MVSSKVGREKVYYLQDGRFAVEIMKQEEEEARKKAAKDNNIKQNKGVDVKCSVDDVTDDDNDETPVCPPPVKPQPKQEAGQLDMFAALGM